MNGGKDDAQFRFVKAFDKPVRIIRIKCIRKPATEPQAIKPVPKSKIADPTTAKPTTIDTKLDAIIQRLDRIEARLSKIESQ